MEIIAISVFTVYDVKLLFLPPKNRRYILSFCEAVPLAHKELFL